jgi:hypothetical protein
MEVKLQHGARAWLSDPKHPNFEAAARATEKVYGSLPDYTREGGSIPITSAFEEATKMNVCLLPVGACDDMAHSQNEKYNKKNLVNGIKVGHHYLFSSCHLVYFLSQLFFVNVYLCLKVLGIYLHELAKLTGPKPSACRCVELTDEELMEPGAFMRGFKCKCIM